MFVYVESEPGLWTVGHYAIGGKKDGKFVPESDQQTEEAAAERCHWLNGGAKPGEPTVQAESEIRERVYTAIAVAALQGPGAEKIMHAGGVWLATYASDAAERLVRNITRKY